MTTCQRHYRDLYSIDTFIQLVACPWKAGGRDVCWKLRLTRTKSPVSSRVVLVQLRHAFSHVTESDGVNNPSVNRLHGRCSYFSSKSNRLALLYNTVSVVLVLQMHRLLVFFHWSVSTDTMQSKCDSQID
jgi:hypothetical protein